MANKEDVKIESKIDGTFTLTDVAIVAGTNATQNKAEKKLNSKLYI
jgi:hypothetical protein